MNYSREKYLRGNEQYFWSFLLGSGKLLNFRGTVSLLAGGH